jgi:hypothetical protein
MVDLFAVGHDLYRERERFGKRLCPHPVFFNPPILEESWRSYNRADIAV